MDGGYPSPPLFCSFRRFWLVILDVFLLKKKKTFFNFLYFNSVFNFRPKKNQTNKNCFCCNRTWTFYYNLLTIFNYNPINSISMNILYLYCNTFFSYSWDYLLLIVIIKKNVILRKDQQKGRITKKSKIWI